MATDQDARIAELMQELDRARRLGASYQGDIKGALAEKAKAEKSARRYKGLAMFTALAGVGYLVATKTDPGQKAYDFVAGEIAQRANEAGFGPEQARLLIADIEDRLGLTFSEQAKKKLVSNVPEAL